MFRKIIASFFLIAFLSLTGFLIYSALQPEKLPIGSAMPHLEYQTANGMETLKIDSLRNTMVVYFHSECKYCKYELQLLDEHLQQFNTTMLILLTQEEDFFVQKKMQPWLNLMTSPGVSWGIVDKNKFKEKFGAKGYPSTYIFDNKGILNTKIFGEAKLDRLLYELRKNSGGPKRRVSGLN